MQYIYTLNYSTEYTKYSPLKGRRVTRETKLARCPKIFEAHNSLRYYIDTMNRVQI